MTTTGGTPGDEASRALAAGFVVVDEATLRSIMQTAILDAHAEAQLRYDTTLLAEKSAENEKLRERVEAAEKKMQEASRWWRRWLPSAAIVSIVGGIVALTMSLYLISTAGDSLARKAENLLSDQLLRDVTTVVMRVAENEVALSEATMDERLMDVELQLTTLRVDVRSEVRDELAAFRADLLRELRKDQAAPQKPDRPL